MITIRRRLSQFIDSCPRPKYDTGCTYCQVPEFPADKQIDYKRNLQGTQPQIWKHLLILSHGYPSMEAMPPRIELAAGTLSSELSAVKRRLFSPNHPVAISNVVIDGALPSEPLGPQENYVYLFPDRKIIRFDTGDLRSFIDKYLVPEDKPTAYNPFASTPSDNAAQITPAVNFTEHDLEDELVLVCGHGLRDVRCGVLGSMLQQEFELVLRRENLLEVRTGLITHVGGHAYAGNVIYFPRRGQPIWYGRVFPPDVQGIVDSTLKQGLIIRDKYRGYADGA